MSDEYIPTTNEILDALLIGHEVFVRIEGFDEFGPIETRLDPRTAFQRWCAHHDAEVRAEAQSAVSDELLDRHPRGQAIRTVAASIREHLLRDYDEDGDEWGMYPEIGEGDWAEVVGAVRARAEEVSPEDFEAAYGVLQAAADNGESDDPEAGL